MTNFRPSDSEGSRRSPPRTSMTKLYENRCPLLSYAALERLKERREQRERQFEELLEAPAKETEFHSQRVARRQEIIDVAERAGIEGVREFADGLLLSQGRLAVHAVLLREYTALLVGEIRDRINASELFQPEPLPTWRQDSIAQKAIRACEEILAERGNIEDPLSNGIDGYTPNPTLTWPPLVQEWEALKFARKVVTENRERIPESDLRKMIAAQYGGKAEDLTLEEMRPAAVELCRHYHSFQAVPDEIPGEIKSKEALPRAGDHFWKEREDEFRRYDTPENTLLGAMGFEHGWTFHGGPGKPVRESQQLFQTLARLAANGLVGPPGAEPWVDWLNALQHARDRSTGKPLYGKVTSGHSVIGESWLKRMVQLGEPIPAGGITEFVLISKDKSPVSSESPGAGVDDLKVETRLCWDTPFVTIESLFKTSANYCLELRSLSAQPRDAESESLDRAREMEGIPENAMNQFEEDVSAAPLGDNPFPPDHPAHAIFEEATWKAKAKIAPFKLEFLGTGFATKNEFIQSLLTFRKRWFTTTAFEATLIVGNEETAQWYELWIDEHANWLLEDTLSQARRKDPKAAPADFPFFSPEDLENIENHLKLELVRMVAHYKGVAASRVVEVIERRNAMDIGAATEVEVAASADDAVNETEPATLDDGREPVAELQIETQLGEVARRERLLADYKQGAGNPSNKRIYEARNSSIHKPQFYEWLRGDLPATSETTINFERFLREKKSPIPRTPRL